MGEVNDPGGYENKYNRARKRLENDDIDEEDRRAIRSFIDHKEATGDHAYSTLESYTTVLLRAADLAHKPLTQWQDKDPQNGVYQSDYDTFIKGMQTGEMEGVKDGGYSDEYIRSFKQYFRPFFRYIGEEWSEDIEIGQPTRGKITEDDCFTSDETSQMFRVADARDSAIIALMLATGQRASAVASLKLDDVEFQQNRGRFRLNPEATGLKGAEGWRPMLWASPYIKRWVNEHHPATEQDDAPLFCCKRNGAHYSIGDPMSYDAIKRVVKTTCDKAGVNGDKAQAHRMRHTAIRRMIRDGLTEQQIKFMVGWHEDTQQLARYGSLKDKTHSSDIEGEYGYTDNDDDGEKIGISHENCPKCNSPLSELVDPAFCPDCGLPLKHSAEETEKAISDSVVDSYKQVNPDDSETMDKIDELDALLDDPDVKAALLEKLQE